MSRSDAYVFRARLIPVAVVILPPLVLLGAGVVSGARLGIATGLVTTVLGAIAGELGRDRGRALQPGLWRQWGGSPTLRRLRFATGGRRERVERLHARIADVVGEPLPSESDELGDPHAADDRYEEAVQRLIALTRDRKRFDLLFDENVSYGRRRNLLGLRPIGIAVAAATLVSAVVLFAAAGVEFAQGAARFGPGGAVALAALAFWTRVVSPDWVLVPAEAYADRLMEAVDALRADVQDGRPRDAQGGRAEDE